MRLTWGNSCVKRLMAGITPMVEMVMRLGLRANNVGSVSMWRAVKVLGLASGKHRHVGGFLSTTLLACHRRFEHCPALSFEHSREGFQQLVESTIEAQKPLRWIHVTVQPMEQKTPLSVGKGDVLLVKPLCRTRPSILARCLLVFLTGIWVRTRFLSHSKATGRFPRSFPHSLNDI